MASRRRFSKEFELGAVRLVSEHRVGPVSKGRADRRRHPDRAEKRRSISVAEPR